MNTLIKNPSALAKRTAERRTRRSRPNYPSITSGQRVRVNRDECGHNTEFHTALIRSKGHSPVILSGQFVFARPANKPSRSKYAPHVGKKQDRKILAKLHA